MVFGLMSSSLLLYLQRFRRCVPRSSSGVSCRTQKSKRNFEPHPLFNLRRSFALIPLTITGYHIYQPLRSGRMWHKVNFYAEFNGFEFRVFLLLDYLPNQGWRTQSTLLFTHCWRENNWIHIFPKGISAMRNAISLAQDLNSCRRVHFLRR